MGWGPHPPDSAAQVEFRGRGPRPDLSSPSPPPALVGPCAPLLAPLTGGGRSGRTGRGARRAPRRASLVLGRRAAPRAWRACSHSRTVWAETPPVRGPCWGGVAAPVRVAIAQHAQLHPLADGLTKESTAGVVLLSRGRVPPPARRRPSPRRQRGGPPLAARAHLAVERQDVSRKGLASV